MNNVNQLYPNPVAVPQSALIIEKIHNCADCPIRRLATKRPKSIFARLHNWHMKWWPGWKAHQARQFACRAAANLEP